MNGQVDWSELFFSAAGRAARAPALLAAAMLVAIGALYEAVVGPTLHWLTGWFISPALISCGACVLSKRLHDRGRSGWWAGRSGGGRVGKGWVSEGGARGGAG